MSLARFMVDPSKVRVSIRQARDRWIAFIAPRDGRGETIYYNSSNPSRAILKALQLADRKKMKGIDLGMQWAYIHPMEVAG
jgi:hypothetical protein